MLLILQWNFREKQVTNWQAPELQPSPTDISWAIWLNHLVRWYPKCLIPTRVLIKTLTWLTTLVNWGVPAVLPGGGFTGMLWVRPSISKHLLQWRGIRSKAILPHAWKCYNLGGISFWPCKVTLCCCIWCFFCLLPIHPHREGLLLEGSSGSWRSHTLAGVGALVTMLPVAG